MKVCIKAHWSEAFGEVPLGALFDNDAPAVAETPTAFRNVRRQAGSTLEVDDEVED